jgi:hypothetical protein
MTIVKQFLHFYLAMLLPMLMLLSQLLLLFLLLKLLLLLSRLLILLLLYPSFRNLALMRLEKLG